MRDDASRARLVEMGFELYVPRGLRATPTAAASRTRKRVALVSRDGSASATTLVAHVARSLILARIDAAVVRDGTGIGDAAGLVVFGASLAREIGAALPPGRQEAIAWAGAAEPREIAGSTAAKRALWSELRRLVRALADA